MLPTICIALLLGLCLPTGLEPAGWHKVRVSLTTPQTRYLIGEPVALDIGVENVTQGPIRLQEALDREIQTYLSHDGRVFQRFPVELLGTKVERRSETLKPGEVWKYRLRLLCNTFSETLFFDKPGTYFIKCEYPLMLLGTQKSDLVPSQTVRVTIVPPTGEDARAWQRLGTRRSRSGDLNQASAHPRTPLVS
jgi:hypothetical protein